MLNPFNYSLGEVQKALIALVGFLAFAVFFLLKTDFDPGLVPALQALVPTGFAVIAVFLATNHTAESLEKALLGFISAGVGVWQYFGDVEESTVEVLGILAGYLATFIGVYWKKNTGIGEPGHGSTVEARGP